MEVDVVLGTSRGDCAVFAHGRRMDRGAWFGVWSERSAAPLMAVGVRKVHETDAFVKDGSNVLRRLVAARQVLVAVRPLLFATVLEIVVPAVAWTVSAHSSAEALTSRVKIVRLDGRLLEFSSGSVRIEGGPFGPHLCAGHPMGQE